MQGSELKALRKAAGLSQAELAAAIGMARETVGAMERGDAPIERRTEAAIRRTTSDNEVIEYGYTVEEVAVGGYAVVFRFTRRPQPMKLHSQTVLYGYFSRADHAERWAAALRRAPVPRMQKRLDDAVAAAIELAAKKKTT